MAGFRVWGRRLAKLVGVLALLAMSGAGYVWFASEHVSQRRYAVPLTPIAVPHDAQSIAEGERLTKVLGCNGGCHGRTGLEGHVFADDPWYGRIVAPDLTRIAAEYTDAELARAIGHGVRRDGTGLLVMPSDMFAHLDDADLGRVIAYLRAAPATASTLPAPRIGPLGRLAMASGKDSDFSPAAARIDHAAPPSIKPDPADPRAYGRYLALSSCSECHAQDLRGIHVDGFFSPPLVVVAGYTREEFAHLLRAGEPRDGRELGLMGRVARERFSHFTDTEVDALHAYLSMLVTEQ